MAGRKVVEVSDEVRTRRLVIVDQEGKEVARIASDGSGVTFDLLDKEGNRRVRLQAGSKSTVFTLKRPDGRGHISMEAAEDYMNLCFHVGDGASEKSPLYLVAGDSGAGITLQQPGSGSFVSVACDRVGGTFLNIVNSSGDVVCRIEGGDDGSSLVLTAPFGDAEGRQKQSRVPTVSARISANPEGVTFEAKGPDERIAAMYLDAPSDEGGDSVGLLLAQSHGLRAHIEVTSEASSDEACFGIWDPDGQPRVQVLYSHATDFADLYVTNRDVDDEWEESSRIYRKLSSRSNDDED